MKYSDLEKLGDVEMEKKKNALKESIVLFRLEHSLGNSAKNTNLIKNARKSIAKILTIQSKRENL